MFGIDVHNSLVDRFVDGVKLCFHGIVSCFERPLDGVEFFFGAFFDFPKSVKQLFEQFLVFDNPVFIGFLQDVRLFGDGQCLIFECIIDDLQLFGKGQCLILNRLDDF